MSVLRRKPYIEEVLGRMSSTDIASLKTAINSNSSTSRYSLRQGASDCLPIYSGNEKIIGACEFEVESGKPYKPGFIVYTKTIDDTPVRFCMFIAYHRFQDLALYRIDYANRIAEKINEYCDINELRRVIDDTFEAAPGGTDAWVDKMKEVMDYDATNSEVEVGTHLYVDGKIEIGDTGGSAGDLVVGHEIIIDDLQKIVDTNGTAFIPDPSGHMNEVLTHITTGYTWKKAFELAGFEVVAKSVFEGSGYVKKTYTVYFVWNDTLGDNYGEVYVRYFQQ